MLSGRLGNDVRADARAVPFAPAFGGALLTELAHAPLNLVDQYIGNLRMYQGIAMDVGDRDGLRTGAAALHEAMNAYGLANTFEIYSGTHTSAMGVRFQTHVLPFFGRNLCGADRCI